MGILFLSGDFQSPMSYPVYMFIIVGNFTDHQRLGVGFNHLYSVGHASTLISKVIRKLTLLPPSFTGEGWGGGSAFFRETTLIPHTQHFLARDERHLYIIQRVQIRY